MSNAKQSESVAMPIGMVSNTTKDFFETRSDAELIAQWVVRHDMVKQAKAEMELIEQVLEPRFDATKTTDPKITEVGVAERKVINTWRVDDSRIDELHQKLGAARYSEYINEELQVTVPDKQARLLRDLLGESYNGYFIERTKYTVTAQGRATLRSDPKLMRSVSKAITIGQTVTVKVRPVERT